MDDGAGFRVGTFALVDHLPGLAHNALLQDAVAVPDLAAGVTALLRLLLNAALSALADLDEFLEGLVRLVEHPSPAGLGGRVDVLLNDHDEDAQLFKLPVPAVKGAVLTADGSGLL